MFASAAFGADEGITLNIDGEGSINFYTLEKISGDSYTVYEKTENGTQYIDELELSALL